MVACFKSRFTRRAGGIACDSRKVLQYSSAVPEITMTLDFWQYHDFDNQFATGVLVEAVDVL